MEINNLEGRVWLPKTLFGREYCAEDIVEGGRSLFFYRKGDDFGVKYIELKGAHDHYAKSEYDARREAEIGKSVGSWKQECIPGVEEYEYCSDPLMGMALRVPYGGYRLNRVEIKSELNQYRILRDVSQAVSLLAANGLVHNDISPQNIVVNPETMRAALIDLGECRRIGYDVDFAGVNPLFSAPEREMDGQGSPSSDVYSLGRVAQLLLAVGDKNEDNNDEGRRLANPFGELLSFKLDESIRREPAARPSAAQLYRLLDDFIAQEDLMAQQDKDSWWRVKTA